MENRENEIVSKIEGIGPVYGEKLSKEGIETLEDLRGIDIGDTSRRTGVSERLLVKWRSSAILQGISGIDHQIAEVLVNAGVTHLQKLLDMGHEKILQVIEDAIGEEEIRNIIPDDYIRTIALADVQEWLKSACKKARMILNNDLIDHIEGIGPKLGTELAALGLKTRFDIITKDVSERPEKIFHTVRYKKWKDMATLQLIPGIDKQISEVLVVNGIRTLDDVDKLSFDDLRQVVDDTKRQRKWVLPKSYQVDKSNFLVSKSEKHSDGLRIAKCIFFEAPDKRHLYIDSLKGSENVATVKLSSCPGAAFPENFSEWDKLVATVTLKRLKIEQNYEGLFGGKMEIEWDLFANTIHKTEEMTGFKKDKWKDVNWKLEPEVKFRGNLDVHLKLQELDKWYQGGPDYIGESPIFFDNKPTLTEGHVLDQIFKTGKTTFHGHPADKLTRQLPELEIYVGVDIFDADVEVDIGYIDGSTNPVRIVDILEKDQKSMAEQFSPIYYNHNDELWEPIDVNAMLDNSILCDLSHRQVEQYDPHNLPHDRWDILIKLKPKFFKKVKKEKKGFYERDYRNVVYCNVYAYENQNTDSRYYVVTYYFFYLINKPPVFGPLGDWQFRDRITHEGDWEAVRFLLDEKKKVIKSIYSQHYDSVEVSPEGEGTHPVVYSAKGGHASYPDEGEDTDCKIIDDIVVTKDIRKKGIRRTNGDGYELEIINADSNSKYYKNWIDFKGMWGDMHHFSYGPRGPRYRFSAENMWWEYPFYL